MNISNIELYGYSVPERQKTYTVSGMDEFIRSYNEIDESTLSQFKDEALTAVETWLLEGTDSFQLPGMLYPSAFPLVMKVDPDSVVISAIDLQSAYFEIRKPGALRSHTENHLILIYKVTFTSEHTKDGETDIVYIPALLGRIIKEPNGSIYSDSGGFVAGYDSSNNDDIYTGFIRADESSYDIEEITF